VAVQSHFFGVGSLVSWAEAGVGAVATQSVVEPAYGPRGLGLMRDGKSAPAALHQLLADDPQEPSRQVAMIDRGGRVAVHTGARCIRQAGHAVGDQVSAQANIMERDTVPAAMVRAYSAASGAGFAERLLAALAAAEGEGGDLRGRQSSALVVGALDLRVEDHADPVTELRRLLVLRRAYEAASAGDELLAEGRIDEAAPLYERASALAPDNHELMFWAGLAAAQGGDMDRGVEQVRRAIALQPAWRELLARLRPEHAPAAAAVREAL